MLPDFRLSYKATVIKKHDIDTKNRHMDQWNRIEPRNKPMHLWSVNPPTTKEARIHNGEKTVSSISGAGKTRQPCKRMKLEHSLTPYTKINSK